MKAMCVWVCRCSFKKMFSKKNIDVDIDLLISEQKIFSEFVYTALDDAVNEINKRSSDVMLKNYLDKMLPAGIPSILDKKKHAFLSRCIATPNYETSRFIDIVCLMDDFQPLFWEYGMDKFKPNVNISKHSLGKMTFCGGLDKKGNKKIQHINIVDFNKYNGKKLKDIRTIWGQDLIDFHHELFDEVYGDRKIKTLSFFDASEWYFNSGREVAVYYKYILSLFLIHGVLFENFLLDDFSERQFIRNVFLPAFIEITKETGKKPLIVSLGPPKTESDKFWLYYPHKHTESIKTKLNLI